MFGAQISRHNKNSKILYCILSINCEDFDDFFKVSIIIVQLMTDAKYCHHKDNLNMQVASI